MSDEQKHVELAIALFERGFPEHRIEAALRHCSTLDSAITWLEHDQLVLARLLPDDDDPLLPGESRKRMNKKSATASVPSQQFKTRYDSYEHEGVHVAASPLRMRSETRNASSLADVEIVPDVSGCEKQLTAVAVDSPEKLLSDPLVTPSSVSPMDPLETKIDSSCDREVASVTPICPLAPNEAKAWWQNAASQWVEIMETLRGNAMFPKRLASNDDVVSPTKKLRSESPNVSCNESAVRGDACNTEELEAFDGKVCHPSSSSAAHDTSSPRLSPHASNSRRSLTPGTSPRAQMKYNSSRETCSICCEDVEKGEAVTLGCRHGWYCGSCMRRHAEARLEVGAAHVACPECAVPIADCNLRRLLSSDIMERLLSRSLEQAVAATSDLWVCPTPNCPVRVSLEEGDLPMLQCTECGKQSCLHCGAQPYHKGLTCEEYAERCRLRGRKKAAEQAEESFRQWMQETGTMKCPTCSIAISKQNLQAQSTQYQECHKMMCRNCKTKFCFKCGKVLTESFTCRCSIDAHGFVDPTTGKRVQHLKAEKTPPSKAGRPAKKKGGH